MKIAIGHKIQIGPWGGGNNFTKTLVNFLLEAGHQVYFDLSRNDLDVILITDPRPRNPAVSFKISEVYNYKLFKNRNVKIFHRINECDERKGTKLINFRLRNANLIADHTIFIATWLKDLDVWSRKNDFSVILNGGDQEIFYPIEKSKNTSGDKLKLVTHHWGAHKNKGFDVYGKIASMLDDPFWSSKFEFTYVGNFPKNFFSKNINCIKPLSGVDLGNELRRHDIYLTASINEPAGMHHVEGALCGLPLLYRNSGALPEYCKDFGVAFEGPDDFEGSLLEIIQNFLAYKKKMKSYSLTGRTMAEQYENLFVQSSKTSVRKQEYVFDYEHVKHWLISNLLFI